MSDTTILGHRSARMPRLAWRALLDEARAECTLVLVLAGALAGVISAVVAIQIGG